MADCVQVATIIMTVSDAPYRVHTNGVCRSMYQTLSSKLMAWPWVAIYESGALMTCITKNGTMTIQFISINSPIVSQP